MRIASLVLQQFRSYRELALSFSVDDVQLLIGPNAAGKTNLLEAISLLSTGHSCLQAEEEDMMHWGTDHYRIRAEVISDAGQAQNLEVVSQRLPRKARVFFINDVRASLMQCVGLLPAVIFLPQDLSLFTGSPQRRRDLLNDLLIQISPAFAGSLQTYVKVLKQRNALLKKIAEGTGRIADLAVWDQALAHEGTAITIAHLELLQVLQCTLAEELKALGESWEDVRLVYERKGTATTLESIERELAEQLVHFRERDCDMRTTSVGPHRHDWRIDVAGRSLSTFASRGQQRTAVLALLFLQVSYVEVRRGEKPVILLDDVFSELDARHQERLLASLQGHQVFLTTTHLPERLPTGACVLEVFGRTVREVRLLVDSPALSQTLSGAEGSEAEGLTRLLV